VDAQRAVDARRPNCRWLLLAKTRRAGRAGIRHAICAAESTLIVMAALVVLAVFIALGVAAWRGWLPDTRDPEFSLGRVIDQHRESAAAPDNVLRPSPRSSADRAAAF
jgi:hypothetical protein